MSLHANLDWENDKMILQTSDGKKKIEFNIQDLLISSYNNGQKVADIDTKINVPTVIQESETASTTNVYSASACNNKFAIQSSVPRLVQEKTTIEASTVAYSAEACNNIFWSQTVDIPKLISATDQATNMNAYNATASNTRFALKTEIPPLVDNVASASTTNTYSASATNTLFIPKSDIVKTQSSDENKIYDANTCNGTFVAKSNLEIANNESVDSAKIYSIAKADEIYLKIADVPEGIQVIQENEQALTTNTYSATASNNRFALQTSVPTVIQASSTALTTNVYSADACKNKFVDKADITKVDDNDTNIYSAQTCDNKFLAKSDITTLDTTDTKVYGSKKSDDLFALKTSVPQIINENGIASMTNVYSADACGKKFLMLDNMITKDKASTVSGTDTNVYTAKACNNKFMSAAAKFIDQSNAYGQRQTVGDATSVYNTIFLNLALKRPVSSTSFSTDSNILSVASGSSSVTSNNVVSIDESTDFTTDKYYLNYDIMLCLKVGSLDLEKLYVNLVDDNSVQYPGMLSKVSTTGDDILAKFSFIKVASNNTGFKLELFNDGTNSFDVDTIDSTKSYCRIVPTYTD